MSSFLSSLFSTESYYPPQEKSAWFCPGASPEELNKFQSQSSKLMTPQQVMSFHQPPRDFLPERTRNKISLKEINRNHTQGKGKQTQQKKEPINFIKRNTIQNQNLLRKKPESILYHPEIPSQRKEFNRTHTQQSFTTQCPRVIKDNNLIYNKNASRPYTHTLIDRSQYQNENKNYKFYRNPRNIDIPVNHNHFHHIPHRSNMNVHNSFQSGSQRQLNSIPNPNPNVNLNLNSCQILFQKQELRGLQQSADYFPSIPEKLDTQNMNFELSPSNIQDSSKQESTCFVYKSTKFTLSTAESHQNIIMIKDIKVIEECELPSCLNLNFAEKQDNFPEGFRKAQSLEGDEDQQELSILIHDYQPGGLKTERKSQRAENLSSQYNSVEVKDCLNIQNRRSLFHKL